MSQTRIVLIPPAASMPAPFLVVDEQGRVLQRGSLLFESDAPRLDAPTIAIVPGADVLVRWLDLPVGGAAQVRAAARWALKDELAADPQRIVLALGAASDGPRLTATVADNLLEAWIDYLSGLGIAPRAIIPDSLALSEPLDEEALNAADFGSDVALRGRRFAATVQPDLVDAIARGRFLVHLDPSEKEAAMIRAALSPPLDLLSGLERSSQPLQRGWRLAAVLAGALLLSPLVLMLGAGLRDQYMAGRAEKQALATISKVAPDVAKAVDPEAEMSRLLSSSPPPAGMTPAMAALFSAVEQVEGAELDGLSAGADQALRATLTYPAFQDLETIKQAMSSSGLVLTDSSTVEDGGRIVSEIIVGGPA